MPFQLGWTQKQQNEPVEKVEEGSELPDLIKLNIDLQKLMTVELTKLRAEILGIAEAMHKVDNDYKVVPPTAGQGHVPSRTFPTPPPKSNETFLVKPKEQYLYTQKVINSRRDPLMVVHVQTCGLIRSKKKWKKHNSPESVVKWAGHFNDAKWSKQVVVSICPSCLPYREQKDIYGRVMPPYWNNNTVERQKAFAMEGYTPKYHYP